MERPASGIRRREKRSLFYGGKQIRSARWLFLLMGESWLPGRRGCRPENGFHRRDTLLLPTDYHRTLRSMTCESARFYERLMRTRTAFIRFNFHATGKLW